LIKEKLNKKMSIKIQKTKMSETLIFKPFSHPILSLCMARTLVSLG
jgi:hypothetical protein